MAAPTYSEYHARVRSLGVEVVASAGHDDLERAGNQTSFKVHGVVKLRVFTPADAAGGTLDIAVPAPDREEDRSDAASGPFVAADEHGTGMRDDCDGDPCATEQEREDAIIVAVVLDDEATVLDEDMNAQMAELDAYCQEYPLNCGDRSPGPSVASEFSVGACSSEFWNFVGAAASTHGAAIGLIGVLLAPAAVPGFVVVGGLLAIAGGLAWMYSGATSLVECKRGLVVIGGN